MLPMTVVIKVMWVREQEMGMQGTTNLLTVKAHRQLDTKLSNSEHDALEYDALEYALIPSGFGVVSMTCKRRMFDIS